MRVLIIGVRGWDYTKENQRKTGAEVVVTSCEQPGPVTEAGAIDRGHSVYPLRCDHELAQGLTQIPGVYDVQVSMSPSRYQRGTMETRLTSAQLVRPVNLAAALADHTTGEIPAAGPVRNGAAPRELAGASR